MAAAPVDFAAWRPMMRRSSFALLRGNGDQQWVGASASAPLSATLRAANPNRQPDAAPDRACERQRRSAARARVERLRHGAARRRRSPHLQRAAVEHHPRARQSAERSRRLRRPALGDLAIDPTCRATPRRARRRSRRTSLACEPMIYATDAAALKASTAAAFMPVLQGGERSPERKGGDGYPAPGQS